MTDRPFECSECKRPISVYYTEIVGDSITRTCHCAECPVLQRLLHGTTPPKPTADSQTVAGLCCGHCGTNLEAIRMGNPLGCSECYEVFGDVLLQELISSNKIPSRILSSAKKPASLHLGRSPGEAKELNPSLRLLALNEALNETLSREDYEQAAWLRDQIKALTEKSHEGKQQ